MKTIVLKRKADAPFHIIDIQIADDIVTGLVANNYYIPVIEERNCGILFQTVDYLIENFLWPTPKANVECFLIGHNPNLAATIEHYEVKDHQ